MKRRNIYLHSMLKTDVSRFTLEQNRKFEDDLFKKYNCFTEQEKIKNELEYLKSRNVQKHRDYVDVMCENIDSIDNLSNEGLDMIKRTIVHIELDNKLNVHFVGTAREMYDEDYYNVKSKVKKK